ncbi:hypothetical protein [Novosphingobium taihuense]|uniref:Uncharacterized protein n=1 Tax=Novosphingobium taihuense TaxID=260085 RepID=A0A7W7EVJ8_9SPHN|nr:hypothetical protein [Novosphingobium taihuense]MBB4615513.1 hypothetical protein [Novosphingobium taihuense]TWH82805.1 hypothetical protein IQ25_03085 [Novosphingobium taihuense]
MMVSNMTDENAQTEAAPMSGANLAMRIGIATVGAVFFSGALAGLSGALSQEEQIKPVGYVIIAVFAALTLGSLWFAWVSGRRYYRENGPFTPRGRRATISAGIACVIGMAVGAAMSISSDTPSQSFDLMDGPLPAGIAAGLIAVIVLVLAPITWFWHRNIDEHEEQSYRTGALVALYFYSAAAPIWWLGERGGFLPAADGMALYFATMGVWSVVWFRQRYL